MTQKEQLKLALMTTVEWVQSHYPGVKFPKDLLEANRKALCGESEATCKDFLQVAEEGE